MIDTYFIAVCEKKYSYHIMMNFIIVVNLYVSSDSFEFFLN